MKNLWFVTTDDASDAELDSIVELDGMFGEIFTSAEKAKEYALHKQREYGDREYFIYEMHYFGKTFMPSPEILYAN